MSYPIILSDNTLSVIIDSKVYQVDRSHPAWEEIKDAINSDTTTDDELINLMSPGEYIRTTLQTSSKTYIDIRDGVLYYGDEAVHSTLGLKVIDMIREGFDIEPWINFAENVYANPFQQAREELYSFLEKANLPITNDGCFIAYKKVNSDYKDMFSGRFDNSIGQVLEMPRELVDNDRNHHCSYGFHFCSEEYLKSFGGSHVMLVKINPRDVVSIPNDYDFAKGRTCKYEVIAEIEQEIIPGFKWDEVYMDIEDEELWLDDEEDDTEGYFTYANRNDVPSNLKPMIPREDKSDSFIDKIKAMKSNTITTNELGNLSRKQFKSQVKKYGSMSNWADAIGVSNKVVKQWRSNLWPSS